MTNLPEDILQEMIAAASTAQKNAYSPYYKHQVGSAILSESGNIYVGSNTEGAHGHGVCSEVSAISAMIAAGDKQIKTVLIVGPNEDLCVPCGNCRQMIREFYVPKETQIISVSNSGKDSKTYSVEELLPHSFGPENIQKQHDYLKQKETGG